jgi:hypothetical protein
MKDKLAVAAVHHSTVRRHSSSLTHVPLSWIESKIELSLRFGRPALLRVDGWRKVERVNRAIDSIEALGINTADVAPQHWQHLHNRIAVGHAPRTYRASRTRPG